MTSTVFKILIESICISTHTLTWSVTRSIVKPVSVSMISTHTLTWSVTYLSLYLVAFFFISTHTLTWSVT